MKLLTNEDKDKIFFIDLGDGDGTEGVYVRVVSDSEKDKMRAAHTSRKVTRHGVQENVDTTSLYHARLKRTITDWVGFVDQTGQVIPCTPEKIVELAELNSGLFAEIISKADRLAEEGREAIEKN